MLPPTRLPKSSLFCPYCLRIEDELAVNSMIHCMPCIGFPEMPCDKTIADYGNDPEIYEQRRKELFG